jgi:hypothetical protein
MTTTPHLWRNPFLDNTSLDGDQASGVVAPTASNEFLQCVRQNNECGNAAYSMILCRLAYLLLRFDSSAQFSPCNNIEVTLGGLRARSKRCVWQDGR